MGKKILLVFVCVLICASLFQACSEPDQPVQYDSLSELSDAVGFDVINPAGMPEEYVLAGYYAVGSNLAQIVYVNGDSELIFAMTKLKKIESEFGDFDETKTVGVNGVYFEYSLSGGRVRFAAARAGEFTYAIFARDGLSEDQMKQAAVGLNLTA